MITFFHGTSRDPVLSVFVRLLETRMPADSSIIVHWDTTVQCPSDADLLHHTLDDDRIVSIWNSESIGPSGKLFQRVVIAAPRPIHLFLVSATDALVDEINKARWDIGTT